MQQQVNNYQNNLFYSSIFLKSQKIIKKKGDLVQSFGTIANSGDGISTSTGPNGVLFNAPIGLACDSNRGIVYVADSKNNKIKAINVATDTVALVSGTGATSLT